MRASGRSTLLTTSTTGSRASSALRSTKRVCGSGPSEASTSSITPSTIVRPRSTSPPKSAWPGVSTRLSLTWPYRTEAFLARIVMPRSRSWSIESRTRSVSSSCAANTPDWRSIASTRVVLPWSTCAMIATLRMSSRLAMPPAAKGDRRASLVSTRMEHRTLGRTGVKVSPLCLGAMMFGAWGERDYDESIRIIHRALDAGINFIDTADVYSRGESEEIVAKALAGGRREHVVLATKVHGTMGDDPNQFGNSRRWIVREVEDSLRRLKTDYIALYQIPRPEADTDIDETLGALTDLVREGKVRYLGSSTFPASRIVEAQWVAERRGRERFVTEQPPYSMLVRAVEADVLPTCKRYGMGVIPWSPLAARRPSGKFRKDADSPDSPRP